MMSAKGRKALLRMIERLISEGADIQAVFYRKGRSAEIVFPYESGPAVEEIQKEMLLVLADWEETEVVNNREH